MFRLSEVYASVQGEGPRVGDTTVFVRFGGCNLRCPGWPCDTQHAIDPTYRKDWVRADTATAVERIDRTASLAGATLITFTGGEPFLQGSARIEELGRELLARGYRLEAFTNGTLPYSEWAVNNISMILDLKLPGSGEYETGRAVRMDNFEKMSESFMTHAIKMVCKNEHDFRVAVGEYELLRKYHEDFLWYYGRVWDGEITNARLAELVMTNKLPWKMNVQLHNYIWDPQERGR